ncbi:unnamed protein product [Effrenium voratum]|uniref:Reverse transcriptase Ty1/copia-type domain-containing protein n=1 Tax=Effrenium voratum TaxID=2562239 RepID=A0AA36JIZ2_9DINO|nr:unnamed protein product [Effrenium voratum]
MIAPEEPVPLEGPGEGEMDLDDESMYEPSESGGMQIDDGDLEDMLIESLHRQLYLEFMSDERLRFIEGMPSVTMDTAVSWFEVMFGGEQVVVLVPDGVVDEMTNEKLQHEQVHEGMKTEVESLEKLRVGQVVDEKTAKRLAAEAGVKILGSRWVISQKTPEIVRCRLVVKDFRTYGGPALLEGIYSPTSTVEALRFVLAYGAEYKCHFSGLDVSTAFMYAPLKEGERAGPICLGLETEYLEGVIRSFGERLKPNETLPDLERLYDKESKKYQGKDKSVQEGARATCLGINHP